MVDAVRAAHILGVRKDAFQGSILLAQLSVLPFLSKHRMQDFSMLVPQDLHVRVDFDVLSE